MESIIKSMHSTRIRCGCDDIAAQVQHEGSLSWQRNLFAHILKELSDFMFPHFTFMNLWRDIGSDAPLCSRTSGILCHTEYVEVELILFLLNLQHFLSSFILFRFNEFKFAKHCCEYLPCSERSALATGIVQ